MKFLKHYLVAALLLGASTFALAAETITILWAFNIGSNQANTVRLMIDELNKSQDKYQFVIASKPGAGGTIAANTVAENPNNTLVSMSSSFIIRPYFEKTEPTHNLDNFVPVLVQGTGTPMYVVSSKYASIEQALNAPNLSIGVSGIGSISHMLAIEISGLNKTANVVNFKNMIDAGTAAGGGHVDLAIGLYSDLLPLLEAGKVNVIGYTGKTDQAGFKYLQLTKHRMPDTAGLTANYAIFASTGMNRERFLELHQLLQSVNKKPAVLESYKRDQLIVPSLNPEQSLAWYSNERAYWRKQVDKITGAK